MFLIGLKTDRQRRFDLTLLEIIWSLPDFHDKSNVISTSEICNRASIFPIKKCSRKNAI